MRKLAAALCMALLVGAALAADDPRVDPLDRLKNAMADQDRDAASGRPEQAVAAARERLRKDDSADSYYLLGRALGNLAQRPGTKDADARRLIEEAAENFEKSDEAGGLTYAPAHLGLARVAISRYGSLMRVAEPLEGKAREEKIAAAQRELDVAIVELRKALQISKNFKDAAIDLGQVLMEKGLDSDAEFAVIQFLGERPKDADAHMFLGRMKLRRKRFAEAEPEFRSALSAEPNNTNARRLLAFDLSAQEKFKESAEHWEIVRRVEPKDDQAYLALFNIYKQLKRTDDARRILEDLVRELPGTEVAKRAGKTLEELHANPRAWDAPDEVSPATLVKRLESPDRAARQKTLEDMRKFTWPALPKAVYDLLKSESGSTPGERAAVMRLVGDLRDPQTLGILEVLVMHPREREQDVTVRKEAASALSRLPTDAIVPILFEALTDYDPDIREFAVQGIAARSGKWFRADLAVRTEDKDWAAELELYRRWWFSPLATAAKRSSMQALAEIYGRIESGSKVRVARYALPAMDDPVEATWRAGYEFFRAATFHTFGGEKGSTTPEQRQQVTRDARAWLDQQTTTLAPLPRPAPGTGK